MDYGSDMAPRAVCLALEGGGALGAFTWGVLDRLLEERGLEIVAVSGASAGAMNGAMLVQGLATGVGADGGRAAAKALLETFWQRVSIAAGSVPGFGNDWLQMFSGSLVPMLDAVRQAGSALGRFGGGFVSNPLRGILGELLDPPRFADAATALMVSATKVRTGEARLFRGGEVTIDALLASACLPMLFPAIEIEGEAYWDGGYSSNPPVRALIEDGRALDVVIVRTGPEQRLGLPLGATALRDRINEITFGTPLRAELGVVARAQASLAGVDGLPESLARLRSARLHMIGPSRADERMAVDAMHPSWPALSDQRGRGRRAADRWLGEHGDAVGQRSTVALDQYLDPAVEAAGSLRHNYEGVGHAT